MHIAGWLGHEDFTKIFARILLGNFLGPPRTSKDLQGPIGASSLLYKKLGKKQAPRTARGKQGSTPKPARITSIGLFLGFLLGMSARSLAR